ncbi:MAG: ParB/RepB/Spo0J family partition protein [Legionellales bacterium]|nr:ParB/RepB/Spo0J family partition protein [Legionellales bacterium]
MSKKRVVLGKNLSALLSVQDNQTEINDERKELLQVNIDELQKGKYQPRNKIAEESLQELSQSIRSQGIIQPIVVRKLDANKYEILAGERRWTAAKLLGMETVPVIIKDIDDKDALALALVENLQREDLNPIEEARALEQLIEEFSLTHLQAGETVGKSRAVVSNLIRLLSLHKTVQEHLENGDIEMGHARALLSLEHDSQIKFTRLIVEKKLTVREVENRVRNIDVNFKSVAKSKIISEDIIKYQTKFVSILGLPVEIKSVGKKGSKITIKCKSNTDIENILSQMAQKEIS